MKIKKNFKIIPILNKTLKSVYLNDLYRNNKSNIVLKEDFDNYSFDIFNMPTLAGIGSPPSLSKEAEQEILSDLDPTGKYFLAFEPKSSIIHIYQLPNESSLVKDIKSANYRFSIDNDNILNIKSNIDNVFTGVFNKKRQAVKDQSLTLERAITNAFGKFIKTKFLKEIFSNKNSTLESVIKEIKSSAEFYEKEFIKFLDKELDSFSSEIIDFRGSDIIIRREEFLKFSRYNRNNDITLKHINLFFNPSSEDQTHGGYGNLKCNGQKLLRDLCIEVLRRLSRSEKAIQTSSSNNPNEIKSEQINTILNAYSDVQPSAILGFLKDIDQISLRRSPESIEDAINIVNANDNFTKFLRNLGNKGGTQGQSKGRGEAAIHMLLNTTNVCSNIEPDAIIELSNGSTIPCSIKSMYSNAAQTGTRMEPRLKTAYSNFLNSIFTNVSNKTISSKSIICAIINFLSKDEDEKDINNKINKFIDFTRITLSAQERVIVVNDIDTFKIKDDIDSKKIIETYNKFKSEVPKEHGAEYVLIHNSESFEYLDLSGDVSKNVAISSIGSDNRVNFKISKTPYANQVKSEKIESFNVNTKSVNFETSFEASLSLLCYCLDEMLHKTAEYSEEAEEAEEMLSPELDINSSYIPKGKVLKEVYSHLFKKKIINEGGLAGHMMHPYEALDMTPRQIKDRIKKYSTSQKIIEKVDGQNLFFTVEEDGTLMFARNKEDMTHNDLVEKFTNHPAEVPFISGGNAIKRGVDQWLSSAGAFGQQEILEIFHPDGEARSFINFEIMHKDHPNQLEYGENFIVFHSIVDFIDDREAVYSSNNSQRLDKLIRLMKPGIESSDYTLASNRTVDLNSLTNVQISDYISRINKITQMLDITDNEYLGDGVEKQIKKELDAEGITISDDAIKILYDFALYGEDRLGNVIKSKDFTRLMSSEDVKKLRSINLTNANTAAAKVRSILSPFKDIFVDLGIDLLDGVASSYMSMDIDLANIDKLRDKLQTAIDDLREYMFNMPEEEWDITVKRLKPHYDKVVNTGVFDTVSTSVEGGVYDHEGDLLKVTGGFAPLNQILGAAYRDKKGIFPTFKQKFMQQESNGRSLKSVFNLIY